MGSGKKLVVVLDQHPAHHAVKNNVRQLLTSRYRAYFLPASSSWLNSAEWIFAILKPMWRKRVLRIPRDINQAQMEALMQDLIVTFKDKYKESNLFNANREELRRALDAV